MKATVNRWVSKTGEVRIYINFPSRTICKYVSGNRFHAPKSVESGLSTEATQKVLAALYDSKTKRYRTGTFEFDNEYNLVVPPVASAPVDATGDFEVDSDPRAAAAERREMERKDFVSRFRGEMQSW